MRPQSSLKIMVQAEYVFISFNVVPCARARQSLHFHEHIAINEQGI